MVFPFLPLWIGFPLGFGVFYAGHWHWGIAAGIVIVSLLGAVHLFREALEQRRVLDVAFGQGNGEVVWVFAINWIYEYSPPDAGTVKLGLSDGSICTVRLPHGVLVKDVEKALVDLFPRAVFGFREDFPTAFSANPLAFRDIFIRERKETSLSERKEPRAPQADTFWAVEKSSQKGMVACSSCGRRLSENELKKDEATKRLEAAMGGPEPGAEYTPNLLSRLAMKCVGCGAWICCDCAEKAALRAGVGMLKHANCGGMFKNPE
ncbi:hypothetical protein L0156_28110 [bacterium]|nr:hypothetical protein [bacterium]